MFYNYDLYIQLETAIDLYQQDREKIWSESPPEEKINFEQSERFARLIQESTNKLFSTEKYDDDLKTLQYELLKFLNYGSDGKKEELIEFLNNNDLSDPEQFKRFNDLIHQYFDEMPDDPEEREELT